MVLDEHPVEPFGFPVFFLRRLAPPGLRTSQFHFLCAQRVRHELPVRPGHQLPAVNVSLQALRKAMLLDEAMADEFPE